MQLIISRNKEGIKKVRREYLSGFKFFRDSLAKGSILCFDEEKYFNNLNKNNVLKQLYRIEADRFDEINRFVKFLEPSNIYIGDSSAISFFITSTVTFLELISEIEKDEEDKKYNLIDLMESKVNSNLKVVRKENKGFGEAQYKRIEMLCRRFTKELIGKLREYHLRQLLKPKSFDKILYVEEFKIEYLDYLPDHLKAIIFNSTKLEDRQIKILAQNFLIPLVQTELTLVQDEHIILDGYTPKMIINPAKKDAFALNKIADKYTYLKGKTAPYEASRIKIYSPLNGLYNSDKILTKGWYNGVALIKTEYFYYTKGRIPSDIETYNYFIDIFEKFKGREIHISIPNFREDKPIDYLSEITTDIIALDNFGALFASFFEGLAKAMNKTEAEPILYVPNIRIEGELEQWDNKINAYFDLLDLDVPELGMVLETESAYEYYLDYRYFEYAIINIDNLLEEITDDFDRFTKIDVEMFEKIFMPNLRDIHQHYRKRFYVTHHIVIGNCLSEPDIFYRLLKMGFHNMAIPHDAIKKIVEPLESYKKSYSRLVNPKKEIET